MSVAGWLDGMGVSVGGAGAGAERQAADHAPETFGDVLDPVFAKYGLSEGDVAAVWESLRGCLVLRDGRVNLWWEHELQGRVAEALKVARSPNAKLGLDVTLSEFGTSSSCASACMTHSPHPLQPNGQSVTPV